MVDGAAQAEAFRAARERAQFGASLHGMLEVACEGVAMGNRQTCTGADPEDQRLRGLLLAHLRSALDVSMRLTQRAALEAGPAEIPLVPRVPSESAPQQLYAGDVRLPFCRP